jgi:long-subunit fatty acid transport protein
LYDPDENYDIPWQVHLSDQSGLNTTIQKNVNQSGVVRETGGLGSAIFSGAIDLDKDVSFGITLNIVNGTYGYTRNYVEEDTHNLHKVGYIPSSDSAYLNFGKFYYDNTVSTDLKAVNVLFGLMYRMEDVARFGLTIRTPSYFTLKDNYTDAGESFFADGRHYRYSYDAYNDYGVKTPWVFGAGASVFVLSNLLLSGDVSYTDWTELQWTDNPALESENIALQQKFRATVDYRGGAEYQFTSIGLRLRGGFMYSPSPFAGDPSSYATTTLTGGAGVLVRNNVLVDVAAAFGSFKNYHNNYATDPPNLSRTDETVTTTNVKFGISYRF